MPSSLIFVGLVVLWLLFLVPTVAGRQQEVARLSPALLGGRVLERPMRHRIPEVGVMERSGPTTVGDLVESREDLPGSHRGPDPVDEGYPDDEFDTGSDTEIDDDGRVFRRGDRPVDRDADRDADLRFDRDADLDADLDATADDRAGDVDDADRDRGLDAEFDDDFHAGFDDRFDDRFGDGSEDDLGGAGAGPDEHDDPHLVDAAGGPGRPPARYRPGRGGFDPEAAAAAAHAKYTLRQRVVLALLVLVLAAVGAALLVSAVFWWAAGGLGVALAGYLTYLRRQVRIEEAIRARRAARLSGTRRRDAIGEGDDTPWEDPARDDDRHDPVEEAGGDTDGADDTAEVDWTADDGEPTRVRGTGEPLGVLPARRRSVDAPACIEHESSLPRLAATAPPPVPAGTSLVDVDAEEDGEPLDLPDTHRHAVGE